MRDAFGVELGSEEIAKFSLAPVSGFLKGARMGLRAAEGPAAGVASARGITAGSTVRQAASAMKIGAKQGSGAGKAAMPKIPKPTGTQMKIGGAIGGTGLAAGATGYALGGQKKGY